MGAFSFHFRYFFNKLVFRSPFIEHSAHRLCTRCIFLAKSVELGCTLFVLIPTTKSLKCAQLKGELNVFKICTFFLQSCLHQAIVADPQDESSRSDLPNIDRNFHRKQVAFFILLNSDFVYQVLFVY